MLIGRAGGFLQSGHGRQSYVERLQPGDYVIFYSPRHSFADKSALQHFTAVARVKSKPVYQVSVNPNFEPFRRDADYFEVAEAPIRPILGELDFIEDPRHWGYKFRSGLFEISRQDFERIVTYMELDPSTLT